uniref:Uncharacterized protein n=1 Tax=Anguilla anguilla TaxID=7936 RepID=A0A0E9RDY8_ANGAN
MDFCALSIIVMSDCRVVHSR